MFRIREYLEYKKNKKIAKREMAKLAATTLPLVNQASEKSADIIKFVLHLVDAAKDAKDEKLLETVVHEIAILIDKNEKQIINVLSYMAGLSRDDIMKIVSYSSGKVTLDKLSKETNDEDNIKPISK